MTTHRALTFILLAFLTTSAGCAYRHYLGMHGPSIGNTPDIHDSSLREDAQCLDCHAMQDNAAGAPATTHPTFKGCLKCHSDPVQ